MMKTIVVVTALVAIAASVNSAGKPPAANRPGYPFGNAKNSQGQNYRGPNYQDQNFQGQNYQGQNYRGQNSQGQNYRGPNYQDQNFQGQNYQGQNYRGQNYQGQNYRGQNYRGQNYQGQNYQGQNYQGQNYRGQNYQGQDYQGQNYQGQNAYSGVSYTSGPSVDNSGSIADYSLAQKQRAILQLFVRVQQPSYYPEVIEIAQKYNIQAQASQYSNSRVVKRFFDIWQQGTLPRGEIFHVYNDVHLDEVIALFDLFYFANDFQTFYSTACWARQNYNEGQFVYALSVAVLYRQDTYGLELPPLYEVYPWFYLSSTDIQTFITANQQGYQQYTAVANFSGLYDVTNQEQFLSYFTEDIGVNAYNAYSHLYNPFWLQSEKYGVPKYNRGENFYYFYQQLLARYNLNRISSYLPEIYQFDWEENNVRPGYYPALRYHSGQLFPARPDNYPLSSIKSYFISDLKAIEYRIKEAIDSGYVLTTEGSRVSISNQLQGINVLGNIIEGNQDSVNNRYYGSYYSMLRSLFALILDPNDRYGVAPGPIGYYETALRDPAFYVFQQYINNFFFRYQENLPPYQRAELYFPGVAVKDIQISDLVTYFDFFNFDVSYAVDVANAQEANAINYIAKVPRLNHKPFNYKIRVESNQNTNGVVRVFLGPKADALHFNFFGDSNAQYFGQETYDLDQLQQYFVELDRFPVKLDNGENIIERNSQDFTSTAGDHVSFRQLLRQAEQGNWFVKDFDSNCGFPDRLALPIGQENGIQYSFFAIVTPTSNDFASAERYEEGKTAFSGYGKQRSCNGLFTAVDNQPLGFPFNRPIRNFNSFYTPNMYFRDVSIYHQNSTEGYNYSYYRNQYYGSGRYN